MQHCPECNIPLIEVVADVDGRTIPTTICEECGYQPHQPTLVDAASKWISDRAPLDPQDKAKLQEVVDDSRIKLSIFAAVVAERKAKEMAKFLAMSDRLWIELASPARLSVASLKDLSVIAGLIHTKLKDDGEYIRNIANSSGVGAGAETVINKAATTEEKAKSIAEEIPASKRELLRAGFTRLIKAAQEASNEKPR